MRKRFVLPALAVAAATAGALVPAAAAAAPARSAPDPGEIGQRALRALESRAAQVRGGPGQRFQVTRRPTPPNPGSRSPPPSGGPSRRTARSAPAPGW